VKAALPLLLGVLLLTGACASSPGTFSLASATVDPTYWCPGGANDAPYSVHATVQARNDSAKDVTIDSATAEMVLTSVSGNWLERVGDHYDAGSVEVSPNTVAARASAALNITIPSACTSARYGSSTSSSGDYAVTVHLVTSAGPFSITARNEHEIRAA
jgi:hypothetical protein